MALSPKAAKIVSQFKKEEPKLGKVKKLGKEIKRDHGLAMELWSSGEYFPRLLATLILDTKLLTQEAIDQLASDLRDCEEDQRNQIADWLLANQLMKSAKTKALLVTWERDRSPMLRRLFWYHQARLRWTGQAPQGNSEALMASLEKDLAGEEPEVQWTMNFCAAWIGIYEPEYRARCIQLGETLGLYKGEPVSKNCTPSYLPEFIRIEVAKRE